MRVKCGRLGSWRVVIKVGGGAFSARTSRSRPTVVGMTSIRRVVLAITQVTIDRCQWSLETNKYRPFALEGTAAEK